MDNVERMERLSPDHHHLHNSSLSEDEIDQPMKSYSNTTPEPARTPTMFNVNASEFKVSHRLH